MNKNDDISKAVIGVAGDIIPHVSLLNRHRDGDSFDFSYVFSSISEYYKQADLMFVNLEFALGGPESGAYRGYPLFNGPDEIVLAMKDAGVNGCLMANNHTNDMGYYGMMRTMDVLDKCGMVQLGTRRDENESFVFIREINGIRFGMVCYTYDTREYNDGKISLNCVELSDEAKNKVAVYNYDLLDEFYEKLEADLEYMNSESVDVKIIFIHWGNEYEDYPCEIQKKIACQLSEMGFDAILGGHPHVVQKLDILTNSKGHKTICLYSSGNHLSNQRARLLSSDKHRGYTEDGVLLLLTFTRSADGKVEAGDIHPIPTWVELDDDGYCIIPLPKEVPPSSWKANDKDAAMASFNRTMGRLYGTIINNCHSE